jgi:fluoroquinolone resistance protein
MMQDPEEDGTRVLTGRDFEEDEFKREQFAGVDARGAKFIDCRFSECVLSSVKLDDAVLQVHFENSKIEGINFFTAKRSLIDLSFKNCLIRHSSFATLKLKGVKFIDCQLQHVDFAESDLTKGSFNGSSFEECIFKGTVLKEVDFRGARGYQIDPTLNKLDRAKFNVPEVLGLLASFGIEIE